MRNTNDWHILMWRPGCVSHISSVLSLAPEAHKKADTDLQKAVSTANRGALPLQLLTFSPSRLSAWWRPCACWTACAQRTHRWSTGRSHSSKRSLGGSALTCHSPESCCPWPSSTSTTVLATQELTPLCSVDPLTVGGRTKLRLYLNPPPPR